ncbi:hypothetical protein Agub_g7735, partial [Astrephomene gubernaculifera]
VAGLYRQQCVHAVAIRPAGPLLVYRRTRISASPSPELTALRALVRRRGPQALDAVHPLAAKRVSSQGEWEYWYGAYRLWEQFAPLPPSCRTAALSFVLTSDQRQQQRQQGGDDGGVGSNGSGDGSLSTLEVSSAPPASSSPSPTASSAPSVQITVPPAELRRFMSALLDLLPNQPSAAAAGGGGGGGGSVGAGGGAPAPRAGEWLPAGATALQIRYSPLPPAAAAAAGAAAAAAGAGMSAGPRGPSDGDVGDAGSSSSTSTSRIPEELQPSAYEVRWAQAGANSDTGAPGSSGKGAATPAAVQWSPPMRLTSAQLLSLVNIFTDVTNRVPELADVSQPPVRLVVPATSPVQRLASAVQDAVATAARFLGLLALLAVPLAAVMKAGGGGGGGGGERTLFGVGFPAATAAAATVREAAQPSSHPPQQLVAPRWSTPSAEAGDAAAAAAAAVPSPMSPAAPAAAPSRTPPPPPRLIPAPASATELAALCRTLESQLQGANMWLEVTGTRAACLTTPATTATSTHQGSQDPAGTSSSSSSSSGTAHRHAGRPPPPHLAHPEWPEFQVVVVVGRGCGSTGEGAPRGPGQAAGQAAAGAGGVVVLGCRPVNAAGSAALPELPLGTAALRGAAAAAAQEAHLAGLTAERIESGKATPGTFHLPYHPAPYTCLPLTAPASTPPPATLPTTAAAPPDAASASAPAPAPAPALADVAVLKVALRPAGEAARHVVQGRGRRQREFAAAEVRVRPWYDSDSLLRWMSGAGGGVSLP